MCFHLFLVSVLLLKVHPYLHLIFAESFKTLNDLSERDCDERLETLLAIRISHPALTKKMDISNSGAVNSCVESPHTTGSFRVTSVSTHKTWYRKVVAMRVSSHISPIISHRSYLASSSKRIDISDSRAIVLWVKRPRTTFSFRVVYVITVKSLASALGRLTFQA